MCVTKNISFLKRFIGFDDATDDGLSIMGLMNCMFIGVHIRLCKSVDLFRNNARLLAKDYILLFCRNLTMEGHAK